MPNFTPDEVYTFANNAILPFWALLLILPRWIGTQILVHSVAMPVLLGLTYVWYFATGAFFGPGVPPEASFGTLEGVMAFFTIKEAVVAGWVHYLVFDLFVGAWITRDAARRGISHWFVVPCLPLTLLLGPIGLLTYLIIRFALKQAWTLDEAA
ncbi:MAG TPA: DUF4281 domain-containing protein [Alphaproteobacteria bacterium]|nr:DUF4281 domain-containing protein [Alphaproteobacteria bacterium]HAJ48453.1 DUF4281 domain-containing protein [Alphaproteobacteria bacterium]